MWHIDFETYSEIDLTVVGSFRYAEDPTTEGLILSYSDGTFDPVGVNLTLPDAHEKLTPLFQAVSRGELICAHNVAFERNIWTKCCKFPVTPKEHQWMCTASMARMIAIPGSLDGAANALGLMVAKDPRGSELMRMFSKPQKGGARILPGDRPAEFKEYINYCRQDVRVEVELAKILPRLSQQEEAAFRLDYRINDRGMPVNLEAVDRAVRFVEHYSETVLAEAVKIAGVKPTQIEKTKQFLESRGFKVPNLQAGTVENLLMEPGLPDDLHSLLESRIELSRAGTKKLKTIQACASLDGRIRGGFLFSAASTRRWSSVGVQMHNLQKPEGETNPNVVLDLIADDNADDLPLLFSRPLTAVAQSIRGFFETRGSSRFVVADYSSIEPRALAWSANETWLLEAFRKSQDAYKIAASKVFGGLPEDMTPDQRFLGKQLLLGCGYGMGPPRFVESCKKRGVTISEFLAVESVTGYRQSVLEIVKFWHLIEASAIRAVRYWRNVTFANRYTFRPVTLANGFPVLYLDMPSGSIAYPNPSVTQVEWYGQMKDRLEFWTPLGSSWIQTDTFGGSLTENAMQALTRDVLRDGMVAAEEAGFNLIGHCHDEAISEESDSPGVEEEFSQLLCQSSPWADGFPIKTEGYIATRYRK